LTNRLRLRPNFVLLYMDYGYLNLSVELRHSLPSHLIL